MKTPANWQSVLMHRIADVRSGLSKSSNREGQSVKKPYMRVANVQDGFIDLSEVQEIDVPINQVARFTLMPGDILLIEGNGNPENLGRGCIWGGQIPDCVHQNHVFAVRTLKDAKLLPDFLMLQLQSRRGRNYLLSCAKSSTGLATLNASQLNQFPVHLPPLPEQRKIAEILRTWDEAIEKLTALRSANLSRRIWMRSHLFTGRIRLPGHTGAWREVTLGKVLTEHGLNGAGAEEVFSVSVHKGLINQIEHLGRSFAAADTGHYNRVLPGDIVYTKSPTGEFPLGIIKQSKIAQEVIVSPLYGVFTPATHALGVILDALFESPIAVRNYLHPLVQKGAKNTIAITNRRFLEGKLRLPMDPAEQAAIAEVAITTQAELACIDAEIDALTRQKRGLMQKLLTGEWRVKVETN
ncbi:restriction endonuclease subunit S [Roseicitreum antarcticum]|uniref:Restriction endonuclease S subunit n=1 Tax=Roseicitreum antarcticum TaxID=564137 RepID=A0A1H3DQA4_9RHOB|nr:restriction endonuclease subunit S [Roseicitreum antarcticum]SDX68268.1 Restriction endonuclease S subunit [Roseicitreum antarcticum]